MHVLHTSIYQVVLMLGIPLAISVQRPPHLMWILLTQNGGCISYTQTFRKPTFTGGDFSFVASEIVIVNGLKSKLLRVRGSPVRKIT